MQEILPGIFTWGATYEDKPWDLNGYAIRLDAGTVLVDPPEPEESDWEKFDALKPITHLVLTNRLPEDLSVFQRDFFEGSPLPARDDTPFDAILMNPPFTVGRAVVPWIVVVPAVILNGSAE